MICMVFWDSPADFIGSIVLAHTNLTEIQNTFQLYANLPAASSQFHQPLKAKSVASDKVSHSPLFRDDKTYIVLGGIGGFGVDLAVWMYQHGARQIILMSRRSIASLDLKRGVEALSKWPISEAAINSSYGLRNATPQIHFIAPHDAKLKMFETFAAVVDIECLEILCRLLIAHACTVLEGVLARYHNTFSLILLAMRDAGYLDRADSGGADDGLSLASMCAAGKRKFPYCPHHTLSLGSTDIWSCLEDGLRKIRDGPFTRHIPDLDWNPLHTRYPLPCLLRSVTS
ncbi:hypothetical protein C8R45DRAFT_1073688 [Mycena sanguinolenta]|nr:hypothetical protein C8R45DRAFT_1073688 [Mycena sanguinolenta]